MYSTATVYAGDRNENKEDDSRRHKGCLETKNTIDTKSRDSKKRETQKNSTIGSKNPKTRFYGGSESISSSMWGGINQYWIQLHWKNIRDS